MHQLFVLIHYRTAPHFQSIVTYFCTDPRIELKSLDHESPFGKNTLVKSEHFVIFISLGNSINARLFPLSTTIELIQSSPLDSSFSDAHGNHIRVVSLHDFSILIVNQSSRTLYKHILNHCNHCLRERKTIDEENVVKIENSRK